jgi:hypothetical protein
MSAAKAAKRVLDLEEEDHDVNRTPPKKRKQTLQAVNTSASGNNIPWKDISPHSHTLS